MENADNEKLCIPTLVDPSVVLLKIIVESGEL